MSQLIPEKVSDAGLSIIKRFEGLHSLQKDKVTVRSYKCPAGKYTIGWGHIKRVTSKSIASIEECENYLQEDLDEVHKALDRYVVVPLTQNQYDALASFVFNLGQGNFLKSTLLKKLNAGKYDEVPEQILRWNKARVSGKLIPLKGLTRRRAAEAALFSMDAALADDGGDVMVQKPESTALKPLTKSKTIAGVGVAGIAAVLQEVIPQLQQITGSIPPNMVNGLEYVCAGLTILGICVAAYARVQDHNEGVH